MIKGGHFIPSSMWRAVREKEIEAFKEGVDWGAQHWKNNHDRVVRRMRNIPRNLEEAGNQLFRVHRQLDFILEENRLLQEALKRYEKR